LAGWCKNPSRDEHRNEPGKVAGNVENRAGMDKKTIRAADLEALALSELRSRPQCAGAKRVTIASCSEIHPVTGAHWAPTSVNPGLSGVEPCQRELWHVCEELGRDYELVDGLS
jgi:hypothetical protein